MPKVYLVQIKDKSSGQVQQVKVPAQSGKQIEASIRQRYGHNVSIQRIKLLGDFQQSED